MTGSSAGSIEKLEQFLGIPIGFCDELLYENDWSFVIKLHALLESALNELLVSELDNPKLKKFVTKLAIQGRSGKISLAEELNILSKEEKEFIIALTSMRNQFAHVVRCVGTTIPIYLKSLDPAERKKINSCLGLEKFKNISDSSLSQAISENPRVPIIVNAVNVLTSIFIKIEHGIKLSGLKELARVDFSKNRRAAIIKSLTGDLSFGKISPTQ